MHDLETERFFKPEMVNYVMEVGDGPIKTFALRGVKDNPPYLHDERLLTLDDTVEFFNLVLGDKLTAQETRIWLRSCARCSADSVLGRRKRRLRGTGFTRPVISGERERARARATSD